MKSNKRFGILSLIITCLLTFLVTSLVLYNWYRENPAYSITFDPEKVSYENIRKLNDVRDILVSSYYMDVDENILLEGAAAGMAYALEDPYTVYFTKENMQLFMEEAEGSYSGIGVSVNLDEDGILTVVEPFEGSPAILAGMRQGDKIIKVDDEDVTMIRDEYLIISKIKGAEGTSVKLTVYRPAQSAPLEMLIERKVIKIENIRSRMLNNNIGYIRIVKFDGEIYYYFNQRLQLLAEQGMQGLIIDVRDNPGGSYDQVVAVIDRLIPEGLIVYTEDRAGNKEEEFSDGQSLSLPMVILINDNSASASEILAGAIRDNEAGILVGENTFGKGLVQSIVRLDDGSGLKFTVSKYFTPSGVCIQDIGIKPDIEVVLDPVYKYVPISQIPEDKDLQLAQAISEITRMISAAGSDKAEDTLDTALETLEIN